MNFSLAFVAGVTPTKWTRIWGERRPDVPLEVFRTDPAEQTTVLHDGRAIVSLVRLPVDESGLSVIALYREIPVVVAAKDHVIAAADSVALQDLAEEHLLQDPDEVPAWRDIATEVTDGTRRALPTMRDMDETMEQVAAGVGIVIVPHSIARLYGRKDVVSRPVEGDVPETTIALAWLTTETSEDIEEFVGIVRGRSSSSSRVTGPALGSEPQKKEKKTAKAKAAAKAVRAAAAQAKPSSARKPNAAPGRTRPTVHPNKGKRRGGR